MEKLSANANALNWFEIAITDVTRAKLFYETIFNITMQTIEMMGMQMVMFPSEPPHVSGGLVKSDAHTPSTVGAIIYLNGNPDLQLVLDRIPGAGGSVTMPKTFINEETGYMAFFMDTEGNLVGLHSNQ
jgi:uncharacterized protein